MLYHVYDGAVTDGGPQAVWFRTSVDDGRTWSDRMRLSAAGAHSTGPVIEATGQGDLRVWFASQDAGDRWNVYARRSGAGGATWSRRVKINDAVSGNGYDNANGFLEFYGDYGEIAVTNEGKTVATWGEGFSWLGPGNVWVNVQACGRARGARERRPGDLSRASRGSAAPRDRFSCSQATAASSPRVCPRRGDRPSP